MTYRALLIGNSTFDADASLNPLNAPTKDVARLHRALVDAESGLFDDDHVRLVTERTSDELLDELDTFFGSAHRDDLLLLYYSGHGLLDHRNQLYLCGRTTRSDRLLRTAVSNVRINEFIAQSVARCTVIVLDCCSSGMFKGGDVGQQLAGPGRYVVSSTRGSELANDAATSTGTSLFTEYMVTGLLGEAEDLNEDGYVDLREIYDYVRKQLTSHTRQVPHCRFDGDAAVSLARRPAKTPVIAKVPQSGARPESTFALSETVITLRNVDPEERLRPEVIEIYPIAGTEVDCVAETDDQWLRPHVYGDRVVIELYPREGPNRAKVMVRDRRSGTAQAVRVEAYVKRRVVGSSPVSAPPDRAQAKGGAPTDATVPDIPRQPSGPPLPPIRPFSGPPAPDRPPQPPPWSGPQQPGQPGHPNQPGQPGHPGQPRPPGQPVQPVQPVQSQNANGTAVAALVTGAIALVLSICFVGGLVAIVSLVLASKANKDLARSGSQAGRGYVIWAQVMSWLAIVVSCLFLMFTIIGSATGSGY